MTECMSHYVMHFVKSFGRDSVSCVGCHDDCDILTLLAK